MIVKAGMPETCQMAMMFLYPLVVTDSLSQVQSVHMGTYLNGHNEKQYTLFLGLTIKRALNSSLFNLGSPF